MNNYYMSGFRSEIEKSAFNFPNALRGVGRFAKKHFSLWERVPDRFSSAADRIARRAEATATYKTTQASKASAAAAAEKARKAGIIEHGTAKNPQAPKNAISPEETQANLRKANVRTPEGKVPSPAEPVNTEAAAATPAAASDAPVAAKPKSLWSRLPGPVKIGIGGTAGGAALAGGGVLYGAAKTPADQPDPYQRY